MLVSLYLAITWPSLAFYLAQGQLEIGAGGRGKGLSTYYVTSSCIVGLHPRNDGREVYTREELDHQRLGADDMARFISFRLFSVHSSIISLLFAIAEKKGNRIPLTLPSRLA